MVLADLMDWLNVEVDLLVFNPPYVPTDAEEYLQSLKCRDISAAWAGGSRGREVIDRFLPALTRVVRPGGLVYLVVLDKNEPEEILAFVRREGFRAESAMSRTAGIEQLHILRFERPVA